MKKLSVAWREYVKSIDFSYHIGMRVVKTAIAVMICLLVSLLLDDSNIMQVSGVSAIIAIRPSQQDTLRVGMMRVCGTVLGGAIGLLCMLLGGVLPFYAQWGFVILIPLFMMLNMYICNVLQLQDAAVISCVALLLAATHLDIQMQDTVRYAVNRVIDTTIGVVVATGINLLVAPLEAKEAVEKAQREKGEDAQGKG